MNDLFKHDKGKVGERIYKNLRDNSKAENKYGTIWKEEENNYRIDIGHRDGKRGARHWEFQVNKEASNSAKQILREIDRGSRNRDDTHIQVFEDQSDFSPHAQHRVLMIVDKYVCDFN